MKGEVCVACGKRCLNDNHKCEPGDIDSRDRRMTKEPARRIRRWFGERLREGFAMLEGEPI